MRLHMGSNKIVYELRLRACLAVEIVETGSKDLKKRSYREIKLHEVILLSLIQFLVCLIRKTP